MALPLWLLVAVAAFYNITAIADATVYSTAITELVPPQFMGAAFALRSLLGFGAGVISRWVFGLVVDWARGDAASFDAELRALPTRLSPTFTYYPSEFSKVRLQYNLADRRGLGRDHSIWLQFEFILGAHAAHRF